MSCPTGWKYDASVGPYCVWQGSNPATAPPCGPHPPWDLSYPATAIAANVWAKQCGATSWPEACGSNPDSFCQNQTGDASSYCRGSGGVYACHGSQALPCCAPHPYVPPPPPPPLPSPPCNGDDPAGPGGCTCTQDDPAPLGGPRHCPPGSYCCNTEGEADCCTGPH